MDYSFLEENKIVPVVVINNLEDTIPTLNALSKGGIKVAEITFRTACAKDAILLASKSCSDMLVGAGTVINAQQCKDAIASGAQFIVSPGFSKTVYEVCAQHDIPYLPGVATPTEIMMAKECGLNILKFFPAGAFGGIKTLKAISAAFPGTKFLPTGGVSKENMNEFLKESFVVAVGGSWMMKGSYEDIERLSKESVEAL